MILRLVLISSAFSVALLASDSASDVVFVPGTRAKVCSNWPGNRWTGRLPPPCRGSPDEELASPLMFAEPAG